MFLIPKFSLEKLIGPEASLSIRPPEFVDNDTFPKLHVSRSWSVNDRRRYAHCLGGFSAGKKRLVFACDSRMSVFVDTAPTLHKPPR